MAVAAMSGDGGGGGAEDEEDSHSWPTVNERSSELFRLDLYFFHRDFSFSFFLFLWELIIIMLVNGLDMKGSGLFGTLVVWWYGTESKRCRFVPFSCLDILD